MRSDSGFGAIAGFTLLVSLVGCGSESASPPAPPTPSTVAPALSPEVEPATSVYAWDPAEGDPSVPPALGGPGFDGVGFQTRLEAPALGAPHALQGGTLRLAIPDWPATLRLLGPHSGTSFNYKLTALCYESLLGLHPTTLEYAPHLATHWQVSADGKTYRFRLNPAARWSDGGEVIAADVVATWRLNQDPDVLGFAPESGVVSIQAPSKYMLEVELAEPGWRTFLAVATMPVMPAAEASIPGAEYLDRYQFRQTAVSGPYAWDAERSTEGSLLVLTRRPEWWGTDNPAWQGLYNFERYRFEVVRDPRLAFEKVKKGELDLTFADDPAWWAEVEGTAALEEGRLSRTSVENDRPIGVTGLAMNMRRPPLDDVRVRRALGMLLDRGLIIEKLFRGSRTPLDHYFAGGIYENPAVEPAAFDPGRAVALLSEAGWQDLTEDGVRRAGDRRLELTVSYHNPADERWLTIYQESCRRAGIDLRLDPLTPAAAWKNVSARTFDIVVAAWGASVIPSPTWSYHGKNAVRENTNNITGLQAPEIDALCDRYEAAPNLSDRVEIVHELEMLLHREQPYVLTWYRRGVPFIHSSRLRMPPFQTLRTVDREFMDLCWWLEPKTSD